jgi:glycosyltransferase involved in cell wall biosynthesis
MKIAIVSSEYPPFHGGGIGTYSGILSHALADAGHDVFVVANRWHDFGTPADPPARDTDSGRLHVSRLDVLARDYSPRPPHHRHDDALGQVCRRWESSLYWSLHAAEALAELHGRVGLDIVEFPECFAEAYLTLRRRRLGLAALDFPVTLTLHSPIYEVTKYNLYRQYEAWFQRRNMMEEYCIRHADRLSSPSRLLAETVGRRLALDAGRGPIEVIPNPMDFGTLPAVAPAREQDQPTLLFVGRIEPRKGCRYLIDAAVGLMDEFPGLTVRLIGRDCDAGEVPGSMREFLLRRIPERLRPRFRFEGLLPREEVIRAYGEATACVLPPPWDNFPYTCCEAMAAGACVLASANSGMAEMIEHEKSGLLFPAADVPALAAAIRRVLLDPRLRTELRTNAPDRIRTLTDPHRVVQQRLAHYEATAEEYRRRNSPHLPTLAARTVAVFLPAGEDRAVRRSVAAARKAAARAGLRLEVTTERDVQPRDGTAPATEEDGGLATWVNQVRAGHSDYLVELPAGTILAPDFFSRTCAVLAEDRVAWATAWARPARGEPTEPYVGFDFSAPLELMYHHPVPFAVIRRDAFEQVGGWNHELPPGWRHWDLWLAFHQAGWRGLVIPHWLAIYRPSILRGLTPPSHPKAHELALERIVERSRELFTACGPQLWINRGANPVWSTPTVQMPPTPEPAAAANGKASSGRHAWLARNGRALRRQVMG